MRINPDKTSEIEIIEMVDSFKELKGRKYWTELLKWVFTGVFMGSSDGVPGYSGGTTLALLGFFKRLILIAKSVFIPEKGITRLRALLFMLPFVTGWMGGIFGFAHLTEWLAEKGVGLELIFFFSAFITFSIPMFLKGENPAITKEYVGYKKRRIYLFIGFISILTVGLCISLLTDGAPFHGRDDNSNFDLSKEWWKIILVAYFGGAFTLMPGGSGALIQLLTGTYATIHWTIMGDAIHQIPSLITFGVATFLGMLTMVFVFSWILKHKDSELASISFGMLLASIIVILIVPEHDLWSKLNHWYHVVGVIVGYLLGASFAIAINKVVLHRNK